MAFALVLVALLGVSSVMAGGYDYQQPPAYQQSYDKYYSLEYPEIVCNKIYKLSVYQDYGYSNKGYGYPKEQYYVLGYPEYLCGEVKKAEEVKYDYKPAYKADYKAY